MFEHLNSGVAMYHASPVGRDFTITAFNPAAERIEKRGSEEVIGKNVLEVFPGISKMGLLEALRRGWKSGMAEKCPVSFYQDNRISGWPESYVFKLRCGEIVAIYDDVTERKQEEERTHYLAHYDVPAHLPTRALIADRIRQALAKAKRDKTRLALMFVDLDKFKPVNDELGHDIGDLLLNEVAKRLQDCMRESDTTARIGGDEEQLVKHADIAMYYAKQSGRNNAENIPGGDAGRVMNFMEQNASTTPPATPAPSNKSPPES